MINTDLVHSRIADRALDYLGGLFLGERITAAGKDCWRIGKRGSLAISIKNGALVFYSHEEGVGGDAVDLWQRQRGGSIGAALKAAAAWAGIGDEGAEVQRAPVRRNRKKMKADPPPALLDDEQLAEAQNNARRLACDPELIGRIAAVRAWSLDTVRGAAIDGVLGWSDGWIGKDRDGNDYQWHRGALVFVYTSGLKHRWRRRGDRRIRWAVGGPATLWRGSMITATTEKVFVTEGETDALSLIDAGAEKTPGVVVVGLPNAGVVPWGIADQLAGRDVVLCLDNDKAGRSASDKIAQAIGSRVASLKAWRPTQ